MIGLDWIGLDDSVVIIGLLFSNSQLILRLIIQKAARLILVAIGPLLFL